MIRFRIVFSLLLGASIFNVSAQPIVVEVLRSRSEVIDDYIEHFVQATAEGKWSGTILACDPWRYTS